MTVELNAATGALLTALIEGPGDTAGLETRFEASIRTPVSSSFVNFTGTAGVDLPQTLSDSGNLSPGGDYELHIAAFADFAATLHIERRNVADAVILQTVQLVLVANQPATLVLTIRDILNNQSVRITLQTEPALDEIVATGIRVFRL